MGRANGNLAGSIKLVTGWIAQQMQAVVVASEKAETLIVTDHVEHHLEELVGPPPSGVRADPAELGGAVEVLVRNGGGGAISSRCLSIRSLS